MNVKSKVLFLSFAVGLLASAAAMRGGCCGRQGPAGKAQVFGEQWGHSLVSIDDNVRECIVELEKLLPNHQWSPDFRDMCLDIYDEGTVSIHAQVAEVINECLEVCSTHLDDQFRIIQAHLESYKEKLEAGEAYLDFSDDVSGQRQTRKTKVKKICKLCVRCLGVNGSLSVKGSLLINGSLVVNGVEFSDLADLARALRAAGLVTCCTGNTGPAGDTGPAGTTGTTGNTGPAGASALISEFVSRLQTDNTTVAPVTTSQTFFTFANTVVSDPSSIIAVITPVSGIGRIYELHAGTYVLDYEIALLGNAAIGVAKGMIATSLSLDYDTIAGSGTSRTWIHGRAYVDASVTPFVAIASVSSSPTVDQTGPALAADGTTPIYMARLTILKLS